MSTKGQDNRTPAPPATLRPLAGGLRTVVGASSPLGAQVVDRLLGVGARVRAVSFGAQSALPKDGRLESSVAATVDGHGLSEALRGSERVYDCYEPPYADWRGHLREVTSNVLSASIEVGCSLVVASPLLNSMNENLPLEQDVISAHRSNLIRTCVARMPQLYGPSVRNALWDQVFANASAGRRAYWLGNPNVQRSLLYVADAADGLVSMGEGRGAFGEVWNLSGPGPITGREFIGLAFAAAGKEPKIGHWGRGIMLTGSLLSRDSKAYLKLPYDYYSPFVMDRPDPAAEGSTAGYTPHETAVAKTMKWYSSEQGPKRAKALA